MAKGESLHDAIDEELFQIKWNPPRPLVLQSQRCLLY